MHIGVLSDPENFHTQKWAYGLQEAGAKVTIFSFSDYELPGITCVKVPPRFTFKGELTYASFLYSGPGLAKWLKSFRVDILNPVNVTPYGVWGLQSGFRPMISMAMGADILEYPPDEKDLSVPLDRTWSSQAAGQTSLWQRNMYSIKWKRFRKEVQRVLENSDLIFGDNMQLVHAVRDWFQIPAERVLLNRWGIDPALFEPKPEEEAALRQRYNIRDWQQVVLSPRGMKPIYQGDLILGAFERLVRRGVRDANMIMLGTGYDIPAELEAKAKDLEAHYPNFHLETELLSRKTLGSLWHLTDICVNAPAYDGFSNALCEARYTGTVPLVNDIPAHREVLEPDVHARYIDPFTPEHLADAIMDTMERFDSLRPVMAAANGKWIRQHAMLAVNMERFLKSCRQVMLIYRTRKAYQIGSFKK
ncbi:MAG: glycosyltransferase [Bacteroidota bacterium]